jgi:hypothetical protein
MVADQTLQGKQLSMLDPTVFHPSYVKFLFGILPIALLFLPHTHVKHVVKINEMYGLGF